MKVVVLLLALAVTTALLVGGPRVGVVGPVVETEPARGTDDAADDPAIWVNPDDPGASVVLATNKSEGGGLQVLDLAGRELQHLPVGRLNNVDVRSGFPLDGEHIVLAGATNRTRDTLDFFTLDPQQRRVSLIASVPAGQPDVYGFCLYHSQVTGAFHAVVTFERGGVRQYELRTAGRELTAVPVRSFAFRTTAEGCAADDALGDLYVAEELAGLWKLGAEPDDPTASRRIDRVGQGGNLTSDAEGVAIYPTGDDSGYVILSSQGDDTFAVYDRGPENAYIGSFRVGAAADVDQVSGTDGVDVTNAALGPDFPDEPLTVTYHTFGS